MADRCERCERAEKAKARAFKTLTRTMDYNGELLRESAVLRAERDLSDAKVRRAVAPLQSKISRQSTRIRQLEKQLAELHTINLALATPPTGADER